MAGVEILYQEPVVQISSLGWKLGMIGTFCLLVGVIMAIILTNIGKHNLGILNVSIAFFGMIMMLLIGTSAIPKLHENSGRYKYEVTISEDVSMTELYEKHNVVEQRGEIWIIEDKE